MNFFRRAAKAAEHARVLDLEANIAAMDRSQAVIEFKLDGEIIQANANFLNALGYSASEVEGRHHSMFMPPGESESEGYRAFWRDLNRGEFIARKFLRIGKGGREVWIQASYNPVLDAAGKPFKVIKFATDVTAIEQERMAAEETRRLAADEQDSVVSDLAESLKRLSQGDLTTTIASQFAGAYLPIKTDFNGAVRALCDAMRVISTSTASLTGGANEISAASDDLSRRTEQQAASLEETAAALDQITATVKRSADGAKEASRAASDAKSEAVRSGEVVREAVTAMSAIEGSSRQITQIIGVIDEIAFQTNLLALNAGVEAARAGEAGRGFAVVASEVRALAQRSAEAAKEIKALISTSTDQVERGVKLVGETGSALTGIVAKVTQIDGLMSEIALSSQEQATGLNQVNSAVNQMDQVTQQNAAMVEEATAASNNLRAEAAELATRVAAFQTGDKVAPSAPIAAAPSAPQAAPRPRAQKPLRARAGALAAVSEWEDF